MKRDSAAVPLLHKITGRYMMFLNIENGVLYYEVKGQGEPLLLVHGVVVDAWLYENTSQLLAKHYQVITYDRRGSSRSKCEEGTDYSMDAQISDIRLLLDTLQIDTVTIAGASAGAVLGQYFMQCYPERVKKLVMYEPPLLSLMEDEETQNWVAGMKDLIARRRYNKATLEFMLSIGGTDDRAAKKPEDVTMREMANIEHFLKDEYDIIIDYRPDVEKCKSMADKIILAIGEKSENAPYPTATRKFGEMIGVKPLHFPGYHNLPAELPVEFAICLFGVLNL